MEIFMKFLSAIAVLVCAGCLWAQTEESPEVVRARAGVEKLRSLVEAGALPRAQLQKAEDQLADAEDFAVLRKTLYGQELTLDLSDDMMAAANRRLERRQKALEGAENLVAVGVAPEASLIPFQEELDSVRKEVEIAESRAHLTQELAEMARAEESLQAQLEGQPDDAPKLAERFDGDGVFTQAMFARIEAAFERRFGKALPISAMGETAVHRSLGFDHRGRVDVAVSPDQPEGTWLLEYLTDKSIPYFAFRKAVPGKATGAHIHMGPMSARYKLGG